MNEDFTSRMLKIIADCDNAKKLKQFAENAKTQQNIEVEGAARRRLYSVLPSEAPGTLENDVWQSIHALEDILTQERGKTTRLGRTRQKIGRDKEKQTVADLVTKSATDGFRMLVDRNLIELTFEAVALRHPKDFNAEVKDIAVKRLIEIGFNVGSIID